MAFEIIFSILTMRGFLLGEKRVGIPGLVADSCFCLSGVIIIITNIDSLLFHSYPLTAQGRWCWALKSICAQVHMFEFPFLS